MTTPATGASFPLVLGPPEAFARVREFLRAAAFDDATLCRELKIEEMSDLQKVKWEDVPLAALPRPLRWCLELFARGRPVAAEESERVGGPELLAAFQTLGLVRPARHDSAKLVSTVWLYPADGFVLVSDRPNDPDGDPFQPADDLVFPAVYGGTFRFLEVLPEVRGGDALDLCGGSGVGALHLARTARSAATADITARSAHFAEFNARLNGLAVSSLCGDLYSPVAGRRFDVISAHPPFVPSIGPSMVFRDGGNTGEDIIRRVIEGFPAHLQPNGVGVVVCVARDTQDGDFERRVRAWLGADGSECDVVFGVKKVLTVTEVVEQLRRTGRDVSEDEAHRLYGRLQAAGTRQFVAGTLFVRRGTDLAAEPPCRLQLTLDGRAADFERVLDWRRHCRRPGLTPWLTASRPRLAPALRLAANHRVVDGGLVPTDSVFSIETGFAFALRVDSWVVPLIAQLNGETTVAEVFDAAWAAGKLPKGFPLMALADLVRRMIEHGLLEVDFPR